MKKITAKLLLLILILSTVLQPMEVQAASKYIKVDAFIKNLVTKIDLTVDKSLDSPYIAAAITAGIVKDEDFTKYTGYLTRTDAAVLLNRADEYLHGDTVDSDLLKVVLEKRISDINTISESKRTDVAKIFAKGIIQGYSNGYYIQNRSFQGSEKLTKADAKILIGKVVNISKRAKLSPDGMLIRTTNLPKNASSYEYILACYPNKFYEKKFEFMLVDNWKKSVGLEEYAYPVEMRKETFKNWYTEWPFSTEIDKYLYDWADLAERYLNYVFNVDYRTVDDEWIEGLGAIYARSNVNMANMIRKYYITDMKANHVVVESSIISVEPSTLYYYRGYCMRAYIRYRITADDISVKQTKLIYSQYPALDNLKSGVWRTGVFEVHFGTNNGSSGDGSDFAIDEITHFVDSYNVPVD